MTLVFLILTFRPAFIPTILKASKSSQYLLKAAAAQTFIHRFRCRMCSFTVKSNVCRIPEERSQERRLQIKLEPFLDGNQSSYKTCMQAEEKANSAQKEAVLLRSLIAYSHPHDPAKAHK